MFVSICFIHVITYNSSNKLERNSSHKADFKR